MSKKIFSLVLFIAVFLFACGTAAWADTINWGSERTGIYLPNDSKDYFDLAAGGNRETGDFSLDARDGMIYNTKILKVWDRGYSDTLTRPTEVTGYETVQTNSPYEYEQLFLIQCRDNSYAKLYFTDAINFVYVLQDTGSTGIAPDTSGVDTTTGTDNNDSTTPGTSTTGTTTPGTTNPDTTTPGTATPGTGTPGTGTPGVGPGMPGTGGSPVDVSNILDIANQNTNTTTNNADTTINITGSTIANSNIGSNNQVNQATTNDNSITVTQYVTVMVNGQPLQSDVKPFVNADGRTMLPVRAIAEALGAQVQWDEATQTATLSQGTKTVKVPIGQKALTVDGKQVSMDTAAVVKDGRTLLPVRAVGEALGSKIGWDETSSTVKIDTDSVWGGRDPG